MHGYLYLSLPTPSCMCSSKHTAQHPFFLCILMSFIHPYPLIPHISCPHHYSLFWNTPHTHLLFLSHSFVAANLTIDTSPSKPPKAHLPWRGSDNGDIFRLLPARCRRVPLHRVAGGGGSLAEGDTQVENQLCWRLEVGWASFNLVGLWTWACDGDGGKLGFF